VSIVTVVHGIVCRRFRKRDLDAEVTRFLEVDFPGGRRFHFREPGRCALAVWRPAD